MQLWEPKHTRDKISFPLTSIESSLGSEAADQI